jgi:hypothetical protein
MCVVYIFHVDELRVVLVELAPIIKKKSDHHSKFILTTYNFSVKVGFTAKNISWKKTSPQNNHLKFHRKKNAFCHFFILLQDFSKFMTS